MFAAVRGIAKSPGRGETANYSPSGAPQREDGLVWVRKAGDCEGWLGMARVMFHDATMIRSEVYYYFNSGQYPNEMIGLSIL